jgi:uncharacterized membrane protein
MVVRTGEWISEAWELVKADFWMHALVALIFAAVNGTGFGALVYGPLTCGYYLMIMDKLRNPTRPLNLNGLGKGFDVFVEAFVAWLLIGLFTGLGILACFVGAIIASALLLFTYQLIMDRRLGFWDAISESYRMAAQNWFGFTLFVFLLGLLTGLISLLTCGVGYFVAFPLLHIATVLAYRDNFGLAEEQIAPQSPMPQPPGPPPMAPPAPPSASPDAW